MNLFIKFLGSKYGIGTIALVLCVGVYANWRYKKTIRGLETTQIQLIKERNDLLMKLGIANASIETQNSKIQKERIQWELVRITYEKELNVLLKRKPPITGGLSPDDFNKLLGTDQ